MPLHRSPPGLSVSAIAGAITAFMGLSTIPALAWADCVSSNGQNFVCTGVATVPQAITGANLVVDVDNAFDSNVALGDRVALGVRNDTGDAQVTFAGHAKNGMSTTFENWGNSGPLSVMQNGTGKLTLEQIAGSTNDGVSGGIAVFNNSDIAADVRVFGEMTASQSSAGLYYQGKTNARIVQGIGSRIVGLDGANGIWLNAGNAASPVSDSLYVETAGDVHSNQNALTTTVTSNGEIVANQVAGNIVGQENGISWLKNGTSGKIKVSTASHVEGVRNAGIQVSQQHAANAEPTEVVQTAGYIVGNHGILVSNENISSGNALVDIAGVVESRATAAFEDVFSTKRVRTGTPLTSSILTTTLHIANPAPPAAIANRSIAGASEITLRAGSHAVANGAGLAIRGYGTNDKVLLESGSKVTGGIALGSGSDQLTIRGSADISGASVLDGGNSVFAETTVVTVRNFNESVVIAGPTTTVNSDILGTASAATNKLIFDGSAQTLAGSIMKNWQSINLNASQLTFAGDAALVTGTGTNPDSSLQGVVLRGSTLTSPVALAVAGDVNIDASSILQHALGGSITGNLSNAGAIYWGNLNQTLLINGNYAGGGTISLETQLGGDGSPTDLLHVTGNTSGTTTITVRVAPGSLGAATTNGILIAKVDGSSAGSFVLAGGTVRAGNYVYALNQVGNDWYLQAALSPLPQVDVACAPAMLTDSAGQVSTCTITSSAEAPLGGMSINLTLPASNPRYSSSCTSPLLLAAGSSSATCTITATPNTAAGDGDVTATLAVAAPTVADAYAPGTTPAQVIIQDDDGAVVGSPRAVPSLSTWALLGLTSLMGMLGFSRLRRRQG